MRTETKKNNSRNITHRTPLWFLGGIVIVLLTILVLLQSSNLWKNLSVETASDTVLLYGLSSLNFFALIIFGFIFFRNLLRLIRDRRASILGSKIKTRLLIYFFGISLLPLIAMAFFSFLFMNRAMERWFTNIPENGIRAARELQKQAFEDRSAILNESARVLVNALENQPVNNESLRRIAGGGNITLLEIRTPEGETLNHFLKDLSPEEKQELKGFLQTIKNRSPDDYSLADGRGYDAATAKFADGRQLLIVPNKQMPNDINDVVDNSLREFEDLKTRQLTVRQIGLTTLGLLTFLLFFAASWSAFYVAKGLTQPVIALAEGANRIAQGDLSHRVETVAEDELAILVDSFNQMSARLEGNAAELEERRRYIETVFQTLPNGVISFDAENRVTTINRAAEEIFRLEKGDYKNLELANLIGSENRTTIETLLNRAKRIGQAGEQTDLQRESNGGINTGEKLPVALSATALPDTGGVVLVIEDLSELIAAQRASAWSEVARRMAHEIKNPLTPIQLSAERIAKRFALVQSPKSKVQSLLNVFKTNTVADDEKMREQTVKVIKDGTETILREVNSLKTMVDEFSRFARLPEVTLQAGDVNQIVRQSVALYEDREAKIALNLAQNLPPTMIDAEQLKRVFINLIENAVESFDDAQTEKIVTVKTFHDTARDLIVAEVTDTGKGINPADLQRLFQPYFSTKGRGTGLGLAIVQRIVIEHRGKIKAVKNSPKGAKFIVELPING